MATDAPPAPPAPSARAAARPARRLVLAPCPTEAVARFEAELGVSHVVAQVLVRRGLADPAAAAAWLAAADSHAPSAFRDIDQAVALVRPHLCAAGVALKLAEALEAPTAAEDLDLAALATVADVVALTGENRRLVREGLRALATTSKPGLRALMRVAQVDPTRLDATAVGFRLAPRLNP